MVFGSLMSASELCVMMRDNTMTSRSYFELKRKVRYYLEIKACYDFIVKFALSPFGAHLSFARITE